MLQLELQWLVFLDRHGFAHNALSSEFTDYRGVFGVKQFFQHRTFFFAVSGNSINEPFLRAIIEGNVTDDWPAAEDADFAHLFRTDPAGSEICDAAVGEA